MPLLRKPHCRRCKRLRPKIDKIDALIGQLSPNQRKLLAGLVNQAMPALNPLFDQVLAIPGVAEILKPTIDTLKAKLALLTA
jgi:hypothetical protein